jgi:hypothetical protein
MFPICKPELSLAEISEYWATEINMSRDKVLAKLEGAWWLGEIVGNPRIARLELLKSLFKWMRDRDEPKIVFVTPNGPAPAKTVERGDGSLALDLRPRVFVPSHDPDTWSEASCNGAFQAIAEIPSLEYYPEYSPGFLARKLTCDEYFQWIAKRGFEPPKFWKRTNDKEILHELKQATDQMISDATGLVYDKADESGDKPPNINEIATPVQAHLAQRGYKASGKQIKAIADRPEFKKRRRPPGRTVNSEKRHPRE